MADGAGRAPAAVRLGRVVAVSGSQVVVLLQPAARPQREEQHLQIGALVKIAVGGAAVFGLVSGLSIPIPSQDPGEQELRIVEVEMLGEASTGEAGAPVFRRGVSAFPALGDEVMASTQADLALVFAKPAAATVGIGTIHQDRAIPALVAIDDLLGKHFAILGSTGSGKSCAVALILRAILGQHPNGHVLLLDMHNEYSRAFGDLAMTLAPDTMELPYWLLNFDEIQEIVLGPLAGRREAESAILAEVVLAAKRLAHPESGEGGRLTIDTPVPYRLSDVARLLDEAMGRLAKAGESAPYQWLKARLAALQADARFSFMFPRLAVRDTMAAILQRLFRVPVAGKPISIVDLSSVPSEVLNVVVSVLCRMTFDFALWSDGAVPVVLVCEEAHRYAPLDQHLGFEPAKKALSRIAKEGRKYGVSLCVVSQRPSELAPTVLSQCNTIFALRLSNQHDQEFVRSALSESGLGLLDALPSLVNAEAIAVGEGVPVPVRLCFAELPDHQRPRSGTARFSDAWAVDRDDRAMIEAIVERWRRQRR